MEKKITKKSKFFRELKEFNLNQKMPRSKKQQPIVEDINTPVVVSSVEETQPIVTEKEVTEENAPTISFDDEVVEVEKHLQVLAERSRKLYWIRKQLHEGVPRDKITLPEKFKKYPNKFHTRAVKIVTKRRSTEEQPAKPKKQRSPIKMVAVSDADVGLVDLVVTNINRRQQE